ELLRSMAQSRVRAFICDEHQGKAAALNLGMRNARHDLLVFVDVRPRLERDALRELVSNFADPKVGCAGGNLILPRSATDAAPSSIRRRAFPMACRAPQENFAARCEPWRGTFSW